jgi:hypothetical protein
MALAVKHVSFAKSLCIDQADIDTQRIGFLTSPLTDNVSENQRGRCQMNGLKAREPTSERCQGIGRMLMKNAIHRRLMLATCAAAILISSGCRSMSGRNMFSFRSKPSAEALAGAGPTTTYPAPPGDSATPTAIASIAGGTVVPTTSPATTQVAGIDISPGYAAAEANLAAAQANGANQVATPVGFEAPAPPQGEPSGYTFGSKTFTPKPSATSPAPSSYATASTFTPPGGSLTAPSTSFTPPPVGSYTTPPPSERSGGFDFPTDPPSFAAIATPSASETPSTYALPSTPETPPTATQPPQTGFALPAASAPSFSTASIAPVTAPPAATPSSGSSFSGGYSPGSTSTASDYPTGDATPSTSGSIFR